MNLEMHVKGKQEIEFILSILSLGFCYGLEHQVITIEESEAYLFNPYTVELIEAHISPQITKIIELGCELEDIQSLIPHKLMGVLAELQEECTSVLRSLAETVPESKLVSEFITETGETLAVSDRLETIRKSHPEITGIALKRTLLEIGGVA